MWFRRRIRQESGFTIAEIMVAGLIMVIALIPMVRMFDTSFKGIRTFEQAQKNMSCAKMALEQIQAMPFYNPHITVATGEEGEEGWDPDRDIDDRFWGERSPINYNPSDPSDGGVPLWEEIPEVQFYDYGEFGEFPDFRVKVQMAYLDDDLGVSEMAAEWGPKGTGLDRPTNSEDKTLQMLIVRINIYWEDNTSGGQATFLTA